MTLTAGTKLGRYEIRTKIGAGGMGEVYLAHDSKLDRKVALKILPPEVAAHPDRMKRFVQEAKATSALNHPNIITIYEIEHIDSVNFIATEFIDGEPLRERMRNVPMKLGEVLDVAVQIANALAAAHATNIVHRDIKPENVMIRHDGIAKVLDFGLAKLTERVPPESVDTEAPTRAVINTEPGVVVGTAIYMSPEQARGLQLDDRTDIFSLGIMLYEMVAGRLPFEGSTSSEVMASVLSEKESQPLARYSRGVPFELERIAAKALRKNREQRYQTIKDLMLDLQSLKQQMEFEAKLERSTPPEPSMTVPGQHVSEAATKPIGSSTSKIGLLRDSVQRHPKRVFAAAAVVIVVLLAILVYTLLPRKAPLTTTLPEIKSLAVLPLENLSGDPAQQYFADGMTEEVTAELSKISALRVISRTSTVQYKGTRKTMPEIARELNVDGVIEGSVLRSGNRVRITVQLIHAPTDKHLWAESYERDLTDVLALQSEVGRAIAGEIKIKLTPQEQGLLTNARPVKPEALDAYLKGRDYFNQGRKKVDSKDFEPLMRTSMSYFEQAIRIQPDYALAYAGLARAYHWSSRLGPAEFFPKSKEAAMKAIQIDETVAEAHGALAFVLHVYYWDWAGAEREDRRAIGLNPSYADGHYDLALCLSQLGRHEEAIREINRAAELDPLLLPLELNVGTTYYLGRQYDRAIEQLRRVIASAPNFPNAHLFIGRAYVQKGMNEEGIAEIRKGLELSRGDASRAALLAWALAKAGNRSEAVRILDESLKRLAGGEDVSKVNIAATYATLGDKDQAFAWLEKAYQEHSPDLSTSKVNPEFDSLRSDPRFAELLRRVGLPQ